MTTRLLHEAAALAAVLARENAALATLDLPQAAALAQEKRDAAAAFTAAHARAAAAGPPPASIRPQLEEAANRLRGLAAENHRLLDRAITVQSRVLDIIARAAPRASVQAPRYGAAGALLGHARALPVAIAASA
ncbi:MAG: hypothetical protein IT555_17785 [Acetobacteraceae bacterium]|nr:hypothetical protein [Acetobacteraceae bacterium]